MKTNKKFLRFVAMALSVLMLGTAFATLVPFVANAADESGDYLQYPISDYNPTAECPDPIPMLCIVVNFDANGNGVDDNADGSKYDAVISSSNELYGEQWCHFNHDVWYDMLFGKEGQTLYNYYMLMSSGKFHFYPAEETYADASKNGVANDGIVEVVIQGQHLSTRDSWVYYYAEAIKQADKYVDFSVFDKNGNGKIDERELIISFINGGAELAQTAWDWNSNRQYTTEAFRSRAYYRKNDGQMLYDADGYTVGYGGIFTTGSWSQQSKRADKATEFAVWAHELGHYLGAPDYYDTDTSATADDPGYHFTTGYYSLMGKSCHGSQPSHIDPYTMTSSITGYGFYTPERVTEDGTYTLYSKTSSKGTYNIIKICTPNPGEYYLIENRYVSEDYEGEAFDEYGIADSQGILIWHVDENIHRRVGNNAANNMSDGQDPTLAVYATNTTNMKRTRSVGQNITAAFGGKTTVFKVSDYVFPVSKTWYTSLTEEEAKLIEGLTIEITSGLGEEMTIKVTGAYDLKLLPEWSIWENGTTQTTLSVNCTLNTLNYTTLNSVKCELIDSSTKNVIKTDENVKLTTNYDFALDYTGLTADTNYIVRITAETDNGTCTYEKDFYTNPVPVEKTKATVTINMNSDIKASTTSKVKAGDVVTVNANLLTKKGYKLEGWYLDEEFTQRYDFAPLETVDDFAIYAKWVEEAKAATLSVVGAEVSGTLYAAEVGGTFTAPVPEEKAGYTFGGWYADADCTLEFDFTQAVAAAEEVKIYAKWVSESGDVVTPNNSAAEPVAPDNTTAAPTEPGDTQGGEDGLSTGAVVIIIVAAVVVVAVGAAAAGVVLKKKK